MYPLRTKAKGREMMLEVGCAGGNVLLGCDFLMDLAPDVLPFRES